MSTFPASTPKGFLSVADLDPTAITDLLTLARALQAGEMPGDGRAPLAGRSVALIFQKPSLRTRVSFEVGIARLGGTPVVLVGEEVGLGSREVPRDVAHTLERYVDAIVARVFDHSLLVDLAAASRVPVSECALGCRASVPGAGGPDGARGALGRHRGARRTPAGVCRGRQQRGRLVAAGWRIRRAACAHRQPGRL